MIRLWKDSGKYFKSFGIAPFFGFVNSRYVLTMRIFGFSFGWSKDQRKFI